tara:strand:- start:8707 stop:10410 length:1704 start_codon:yes stop_codon:yes gene_type:complete
MAQDSIAYGESLLADIRDRNDKLRSQAKKEAKKEKWKSVAVNIGMDLANDMFKSKQIAFQNSEANVQNKLQIETGNNYANGVIAEHQKADVYKGGVNAYVMDNVKNELKFEYGKTYAEGNRNELEFNELINSEAAKLFDTRLKEYNGRLTKTKEYLAGGDLSRYNSNIKELSGKGTAQGALSGLISKLTGNSNADLYNSQNEEILRQSKEYQDTYSSAWKQTRNSTLAKAVAENMPSDLGMPAHIIGTGYTEKTTDFLGTVHERRVHPVTSNVRNKEGNLVSVTRAMQLTGDGWVKYAANQQAQDINMNVVAGSLKPEEIAAGKLAYEAIPGEDKANLRTIFASQIKLESGSDKLSKNDSGYAAQLLFKEEAFAKRLVAAGKMAKKEGWGSNKTGQKIFLQAVKNKIKTKGSVSDLGRLNIFDTMFAMQELTATNKLVGGKSSGVQELANRPEDMYTALQGMNSGERNTLFNRLADSVDGGVNYFKGNINSEYFKADILGFKNIFDNQKEYNLDTDKFNSVSAMLEASITELYNRTPTEKELSLEEEKRKKRREKFSKLSTFGIRGI